MKSLWTTKLDKDIVKRIRAEFDASRFLLDRLQTMLLIKEGESIDKTRSESVYDKPRFECFIADQLGYQRCLRDVINLIKE